MIFVTSARPMGSDPANEYYRNQLAALTSWHQSASAVVYFNDVQPALSSPITRFIPAENFPRIIDLAEFCAEQKDWCAILNADIVITPYFLQIERKLKARKACAASSWRFEFDPAVGIDPCERVDNGLDFFAATPEIWAKVYQDVPESLRISVQQWDSWMLAYFSMHAVSGFYDITPSKCVRHPSHGNRQYGPYGGPVHFHGWPTMSPVQIF